MLCDLRFFRRQLSRGWRCGLRGANLMSKAAILAVDDDEGAMSVYFVHRYLATI
jgi:hypothetical protein